MNCKLMCETCIHNEYCLGAYVKDHWCGNHIDISKSKVKISKAQKEDNIQELEDETSLNDGKGD